MFTGTGYWHLATAVGCQDFVEPGLFILLYKSKCLTKRRGFELRCKDRKKIIPKYGDCLHINNMYFCCIFINSLFLASNINNMKNKQQHIVVLGGDFAGVVVH